MHIKSPAEKWSCTLCVPVCALGDTWHLNSTFLMPHRMKVNLLGMAHKVLYWDFIHLFLSPSHTFCVLMVCVQKWVLLVYTPHPWVSSQKSSWCPHSTQNVLCKPSICIPTPVSQL